MLFDVVHHFLLGHGVRMSFRIHVFDQAVGPVPGLAVPAVQQWIREACQMAAGLPYRGIHQNIRVHLVALIPQLDEAVTPGVL